MTVDKGGPAFPSAYTDGMTLRDYFAVHGDGISDDFSLEIGAVFAGYPLPEGGSLLEQLEWCARADASFRYMRADAMIAARNHGDEK